ncbi:MAG: YopX family protein [Clostridium perfringens]|nr:YopX family protein [Clostridium perfringens]
MSRDIKFRAWHKNAKCMCMDVTTDLLDKDYLIFMQYTGLKDVNGKEVYEGDIILSPWWDDEPQEVVFKDYGFKGRDIRQKIIYGRELYFGIDDLLNGCFGEVFEIIGNIYDNPELLRGEW